MIALIWKGGLWAIDSTIRGEATDTQWRPIIWPLKLSLPIGATLLFLQGCVDYSRQWRTVITGKRFERG
jgi:TRAP-type mannitol/chloroaromatic compound transport system permease small subunit